jgi:hypothetical protein
MTELPPGTNAIVDAALEDVAQTLFTAADVPLARSEELLAALQGPAMRSLMHMRIEQIVKHGHTAENDLMLPLMWLPKQAKDHAQIACDRVGVTGTDRDLPGGGEARAGAVGGAVPGGDRPDRCRDFEQGVCVMTTGVSGIETVGVEDSWWRADVTKRGDHGRVAAQLGISQPGLSNILTAGRGIGPRVAQALGYRRVVRFERMS